MKKSRQDLEQFVVSYLKTGSKQCETPISLVSAVKKAFPSCDRKSVKSAIASLVLSGVLVYTNRFSTSHLELNFGRCTRTSSRISLCPATLPVPVEAAGVVVRLYQGAAFGTGDHPTTRLCLRGMDDVFENRLHKGKPITLLDIGTGTGVLAIAGLLLGAAMALGMETDPIARHEAGLNARLNQVDARFHIHASVPDALKRHKFQLLAANLRPPTLLSLFDLMLEATDENGGYWVLSGFRNDETGSLEKKISRSGGTVLSRTADAQWCALVVGMNLPV